MAKRVSRVPHNLFVVLWQEHALCALVPGIRTCYTTMHEVLLHCMHSLGRLTVFTGFTRVGPLSRLCTHLSRLLLIFRFGLRGSLFLPRRPLRRLPLSSRKRCLPLSGRKLRLRPSERSVWSASPRPPSRSPRRQQRRPAARGPRRGADGAAGGCHPRHRRCRKVPPRSTACQA